MEILNYCKLQLGCLILLCFVIYLYGSEGKALNEKAKRKLGNHHFNHLLILGFSIVFFDGLTAVTINHMDLVPEFVNNLLHLIYYLLFDLFSLEYSTYWLDITEVNFSGHKTLFPALPTYLLMLATLFSANGVEYIQGSTTKYPAGAPATLCYICIGLNFIVSVTVFFLRSRYIEGRKKTSFTMAILSMVSASVIQFVFPETQMASLAVVLIITSIYLVMEDPTEKEVNIIHEEMVMGFATLVESKDDSTGGHIKRSSMYAEIIAEALRHSFGYRYIITADYIKTLKRAAPMHDIGKIGIPDEILQKPAKLTPEEYEIMKTHSVKGGEIIKETFGHLVDEQYETMAYEVARYHHEKWNGTGYPEGLSGINIPLSARIMAVADVFDAISAKRCYRDALPLDVCFNIIEKGSGSDFDPDVVEAFFAKKNIISLIASRYNS